MPKYNLAIVHLPPLTVKWDAFNLVGRLW